MRVLIACEFSGTVRDAFRRAGHDAWSCDLLPTEVPGPHHIGDAVEFAYMGGPWDLMVCHPPCTYLSRVGAPHRNKPGRIEARDAAFEFAMQLWNAPIERIAMENPEGYLRTFFRAPDQVINPFEFGHRERKKTLLWLKNLPPLFATMLCVPEEPHHILPDGRKVFWTHAQNGKDRQKNRSRTFPGVAAAMADQWGAQPIQAAA